MLFYPDVWRQKLMCMLETSLKDRWWRDGRGLIACVLIINAVLVAGGERSLWKMFHTWDWNTLVYMTDLMGILKNIVKMWHECLYVHLQQRNVQVCLWIKIHVSRELKMHLKSDKFVFNVLYFIYIRPMSTCSDFNTC